MSDETWDEVLSARVGVLDPVPDAAAPDADSKDGADTKVAARLATSAVVNAVLNSLTSSIAPEKYSPQIALPPNRNGEAEVTADPTALT